MIANTERDMVPHSAVCILATKTRAWVNTLLGSASQFHGTVRVELTLRSAVWWLPDHASLAGAVTTVPIVAGRVGERTAGVRVAWIFFNDRCNSCGIEISQHVTNLHDSCLVSSFQ